MPLRHCAPAPPPSPRLSGRPAAIAVVYPRLPATAVAGLGPVATPGPERLGGAPGCPQLGPGRFAGSRGLLSSGTFPLPAPAGLGCPRGTPRLEERVWRWRGVAGGCCVGVPQSTRGLCDPTRRSLYSNPNRSASPPSN